MTRKTKKGIVGKNDLTKKEKSIGVGVDFQKEHLTSSKEIVEAIKERKS